MFTNNSGYTHLSRIIIVSFIFVFLIFSIVTYFVIKKNISDETQAAMMQAKAMQQTQVSIDSMQKILSNSPHLKVERFFGRLGGDGPAETEVSLSRNMVNDIEPIVMPLSENSYFIISPDNQTEFSQNMIFFYLVAGLFIVTLALLLIIIRIGIQHQLKPLKQLAIALQNTLKDDQIDINRQVALPHSDMQEIQAVFYEYSKLKQTLVNKELALLDADRKLAMLQEQERSYLARELHDNVGQLITSTKAYAHMLANTDNQQIIETSSAKIKSFCSQISTAIRQLTDHLHPIILDKVTLWEAAQRLVLEQQDITPNMNWQIDIQCEKFDANKERDIHLYRIIQESINNIIKHSQAKNAFLSASIIEHTLYLEIKDDGVGIKHDKQELGLGLSSIKTRARCIGAELSINNDSGTNILLSVNIETENAIS